MTNTWPKRLYFNRRCFYLSLAKELAQQIQLMKTRYLLVNGIN
ncbi:MAG: hypothetical protein RO469_14845 [Thermincola sp.]|nr:hypothetical protein [Thermincola sp.]MDT3703939.1 hypothetical protein [Thermincola sp.]